MYITINKTPDGQVFEVFTNASGGCQSNISTITRLTSLALRSGISVPEITRGDVSPKWSSATPPMAAPQVFASWITAT